MLWIIRQIRHFRDILRSKDSPRQLAAGCAIGMMLGLLPKGNLLAVLFSMVMLATNISLATAAISTLLFSVVGGFIDPITHQIGSILLNAASLRETWTRFFRIPLTPWTALYNTVVMGSLVLGAALAGPVYWLSKLGFLRLRATMTANESSEEGDAESDLPAIPEAAGISDERDLLGESEQVELDPARHFEPVDNLPRHTGTRNDPPVEKLVSDPRRNASVCPTSAGATSAGATSAGAKSAPRRRSA